MTSNLGAGFNAGLFYVPERKSRQEIILAFFSP